MFYTQTSHNKRGIHGMSCDRHQIHSISLKQGWTELVLKKSEWIDGVFTLNVKLLQSGLPDSRKLTVNFLFASAAPQSFQEHSSD